MKKQVKKSRVSNWKSPEYEKNEIRLTLLFVLPEFQSDIRKLRKDFDIPVNGFVQDTEAQKWHKDIYNRSDKVMSSRAYLLRLCESEVLKQKHYPEYKKQYSQLLDSIPYNKLNNTIRELGEKYNLPSNFYESDLVGLKMYLFYNKIIPPSNNWSIQPDPMAKKGVAKSLSINIYAPLSKVEWRDATKLLLEMQKYYFPKSTLIPIRTKRQFERDLEIYKEFMDRKKKPVRKKHYTGYLAYLKPPLNRAKYEKLHPSEVDIYFDEKTSKEIALKFGMSSSAVRGAMYRINKLIKSFFGK